MDYSLKNHSYTTKKGQIDLVYLIALFRILDINVTKEMLWYFHSISW